jgi:hypothetical protein
MTAHARHPRPAPIEAALWTVWKIARWTGAAALTRVAAARLTQLGRAVLDNRTGYRIVLALRQRATRIRVRVQLATAHALTSRPSATFAAAVDHAVDRVLDRAGRPALALATGALIVLATLPLVIR